MCDLIIDMQGIGKMYKLYRRQADKALDALGLCALMFWRKNYYQEFWALRGLDLRVAKGERLGIIGRNGAGKSTLLKVITGTISATEGSVAVNGRVQALMELGTGFHPEFTGRQNIRASLSYQGLSAAEIRRKEEEIIDFAELEEFINQPVKTYSSGMYARLAFSTATSVEPEILIIDEILGAGDAYFAAKCIDRMKRLTEDSGATVLFVSHDLGTIQRLCQRVTWIDRGQIVANGDPLNVTKAYYASIMDQEKIRLRARNAKLARRQAGALVRQEHERGVRELLFRLMVPGESPPACPHPVRRLTLLAQNGFRVEVHPGAPMDNDPGQAAYIMADSYYMNWSEPRLVRGVHVRCFENVRGKLLHAPFIFGVPAHVADCEPLSLEIEHCASPEEEVAVELFDGQEYRRLGLLTADGETWHCQRFQVPTTSPQDAETSISDEGDESERALQELTGQVQAPGAANASAKDAPVPTVEDRWNTPRAKFDEIVPIDAEGNVKHVFASGETFGFRISATVHETLPVCWLVVVIYDSKGHKLCMWVAPFEEPIPGGKHTWELTADRPNLRQGEFVVSAELLDEYDSNALGKLSCYCHWNRCVVFRIDEGYVGNIPLGAVTLPVRFREVTHESHR